VRHARADTAAGLAAICAIAREGLPPPECWQAYKLLAD
jgi:hypothetical protein